jgi:AcrR family transcriptional regulator
VFAELGAEAGMGAIATRAGVAVGTLYNHFRDRDALVDALFEARANALLARVRHEISDSDDMSFRPRLLRVLEAVVASTSPNLRFRQLFLQAEQRKARKGAVLERLRAELAPLVEHGQREGELRADPHQMQAAFLLAQLHAALMSSYDRPKLLARDHVAELVVEQFLDGARTSG